MQIHALSGSKSPTYKNIRFWVCKNVPKTEYFDILMISSRKERELPHAPREAIHGPFPARNNQNIEIFTFWAHSPPKKHAYFDMLVISCQTRARIASQAL